MTTAIAPRSRKVRVLATLGPASNSPEMIATLFQAGADAFRVNMSHGDQQSKVAVIEAIRALEKEFGRPTTILADLQGPKLRVGKFDGGRTVLEHNSTFVLDRDPTPGDATRVELPHKEIFEAIEPGARLLLDDGKLVLRVTDHDSDRITTVVEVGGPLSNNKGLNVPDVVLPMAALTEKDRTDLAFAVEQGVDWIALSFVQRPEDLREARKLIGGKAALLAKIEKPQAVANLQEIVDTFDAIMVARGDLGVELPLEEVPLVQKQRIIKARIAAKPVIVATQMLDSMERASRPTRAEASDVANAVLDGADALMLSGETSVGDHPFLAVQTMSRIIEHMEEHALGSLPALPYQEEADTGLVLTWAATEIGAALKARYLAAFTETGRSARALARHRKATPLLAFTPNPRVRSLLALVWGIETFLVPPVRHTDDMVEQLEAALLASGRALIGEKIVIVAGVPPGVPGSTNGLRVHTMGHGKA